MIALLGNVTYYQTVSTTMTFECFLETFHCMNLSQSLPVSLQIWDLESTNKAEFINLKTSWESDKVASIYLTVFQTFLETPYSLSQQSSWTYQDIPPYSHQTQVVCQTSSKSPMSLPIPVLWAEVVSEGFSSPLLITFTPQLLPDLHTCSFPY